MTMPPYTARLLFVAAVVVFVLAALGVHVANLSPIELVACGLALLGLGMTA